MSSGYDSEEDARLEENFQAGRRQQERLRHESREVVSKRNHARNSSSCREKEYQRSGSCWSIFFKHCCGMTDDSAAPQRSSKHKSRHRRDGSVIRHSRGSRPSGSDDVYIDVLPTLDPRDATYAGMVMGSRGVRRFDGARDARHVSGHDYY
ncbi:hypothetical protein FZEAL_880 [Fusarium zealandicum]|uniref:Uncharacterized protein n=1 Tax=Fusarium zealandicum TaxID=1053134 RepID=A0A8H4UTU5_9HYPO|nr:hypothetical protein FZEAL_880 [Fusarium zealandicum]